MTSFGTLNNTHSTPVVNKPWEGGYLDFIPHRIQMTSPGGPPRTCMADDLVHYFRRHADKLDLADPSSASLFVKKIVASNYAWHVEYLHKVIIKAQIKMSRHTDRTRFRITEVEAQWSDVQILERRIARYSRDLKSIISQLRIPPAAGDGCGASAGDWTDWRADFRFLHDQVMDLRHDVEMLNTAITGLASIAGNRQAFREQQLSLDATRRSIREAKSARTLTLVGLIFIPLAYTASLFSMAEPYGPGNEKFGIYFAISLPLIAAVMLMYYILDLGYTGDGTHWSFNNLVKHIRDRTSMGSRVSSLDDK